MSKHVSFAMSNMFINPSDLEVNEKKASIFSENSFSSVDECRINFEPISHNQASKQKVKKKVKKKKKRNMHEGGECEAKDYRRSKIDGYLNTGVFDISSSDSSEQEMRINNSGSVEVSSEEEDEVFETPTIKKEEDKDEVPLARDNSKSRVGLFISKMLSIGTSRQSDSLSSSPTRLHEKLLKDLKASEMDVLFKDH